MPTQQDKIRLLELLYQHNTAQLHEKASTRAALDTALDEVRSGTLISRQQLKDLLYRDGYREYAKRRHVQEQSGF